MNEVLITIIIPVYNTEKYLKRCMDSVCGQTYRNLEIICINDGSTDGSLRILEEYAARDSRIQVLTQKNSGQAVARNLALDIATGEWITGLDSDDWIEPDTYASLLSYMGDDVDIIHFGTMVEDDSTEANPVDNHGYTDVKIAGKVPMTPDILIQTDVYIWNKLFRRSTIEKYGIRFPAGLIYEDTAFVYCIGCVSRCIYGTNKKYYHYIQRGYSTMGISRSKTPRALEHLAMAAFTHRYYVKQGKAETWRTALMRLFTIAYTQTARYLPEEMLPAMRKQAYRLAEDMGVATCYHCPGVQLLRAACRGRVERLFHGIYSDCDRYGLWPLRLWTIRHEADGNIHYCCGRRLFRTRRRM